MANVLTDLSPDLYKAADTVGRELVGFIPSSLINADGSERIEVGGTVRSHFTRTASAVNITESMTVPEGTDQTIDNKTATISKARAIQIPYTGEDVRKLNRGPGFATAMGDQVAQAIRTLVNEMETDLATTAAAGACRAVGTAGTTPFASNFDLIADCRKILVDNGCPIDQVSLVMDTTAGAKLRNLANLQKVNESGSTALLRQGTLLDLQGVMMKESAQVQSHTAGGATGATTDTTGYAIGSTTITLASAGSSAILAGDVITFAGDSNQYVVATGDADVSGGGTIVLQAPGLRQAIPASATAITIKATHTQNVMFRRNALELIVRAPALPEGGDLADDGMIIQDPWSGLVFEVRTYKGYRKQMIEVAAAWGYKAWKPEHIALVLG